MTTVTTKTAAPHYLLVGNDEKVTWDDGRIRFLPPGHDTLSLFDAAANPAAPALVATIPLPNSLFGPPVNLAVTPDQRLALVADSMAWPARADGAGWQPTPGRDLYVVDLTATPPAIVQTLQVGWQPSGLSINRAGTLALVEQGGQVGVGVDDPPWPRGGLRRSRPGHGGCRRLVRGGWPPRLCRQNRHASARRAAHR